MSSVTLMVQGTTSDAGKSTVVAGLCRVLMRRGLSVAPFKPQNMALNSAVTADGGEIGRAQAVQALAAGLAPHTDMNPVLLKPNSDMGAQVIIHGRAIGNMEAAAYHDYKRVAREAVLASHRRLAAQYRMIVVEAPLLLEWGDPDGLCEVVVVVTAPEDLRIARTVAHLGLCEAEVRERMAHQMPEEGKVRRADHVIVNDAGLVELESRTRDVWQCLSRGPGGRQPT